jgi:hypothetical protein
MPIQDPSILEAALLGLEAQKERINAKISQVRALLGKRRPGRPSKNDHLDLTAIILDSQAAAEKKPVVNNGERARRQMSPEGRARIAEAQRRRWAAAKGL